MSKSQYLSKKCEKLFYNVKNSIFPFLKPKTIIFAKIFRKNCKKLCDFYVFNIFFRKFFCEKIKYLQLFAIKIF